MNSYNNKNHNNNINNNFNKTNSTWLGFDLIVISLVTIIICAIDIIFTGNIGSITSNIGRIITSIFGSFITSTIGIIITINIGSIITSTIGSIINSTIGNIIISSIATESGAFDSTADRTPFLLFYFWQ